VASVLPGLEDIAQRAAVASLGAVDAASGPGWVAFDTLSAPSELRAFRACSALHAWVRHVRGDYSAARALPELRRRLHRTSFDAALSLWRQATGSSAPRTFRVSCTSVGAKLPFFELQRAASDAFAGGQLGLPGGADAEATVFVAAGPTGAVVGLRLYETQHLVQRPRPRRSVPPSFWATVAREADPGEGPVLLLDADEDVAAEARALAPRAPLVVCARRSAVLRGVARWACGQERVGHVRCAPGRLPLASGAATRGIWVVASGRAERVWPELGRVIAPDRRGSARLVAVGHDSPALSHQLARGAGFAVLARHAARLPGGELQLLVLQREAGERDGGQRYKPHTP
jgi:hypothetical protein